MVDQSLLTVFLALTAAAILIQTGILVGFYFASAKLGQQADRAIDADGAFVVLDVLLQYQLQGGVAR